MFYSVNSYSGISNRKSVGGLVSGMDTDELVKNMTAGTRSKIATKLGKKQTNTWKQESYREVTKAINELQSKYFTYSAGKNNILGSSFFQSGKIKNDSEYVRVSGSLTAAKNVQFAEISQLATSAYTGTTKRLSNDVISGTPIASSWDETLIAGQSFKIEVDGEEYTVSMPSDFNFIKGGTPNQHRMQVQEAMQESIEKAGLKDKVSIGFNANNKFVMSGIEKDGEIPLVKLGDNGEREKGSAFFKGLGLDNVTSDSLGVSADNPVQIGSMTGGTVNIQDALVGKSISFTFNGVTKKITFADSEKAQFDTDTKAIEYLNKKLGDTFGKNAAGKQNLTASVNSAYGIDIKTGDKYDVVSVSTEHKELLGKNSVLGIDSNATNRVLWNQSLKNLVKNGKLGGSLGTPDAEGNYSMTINGTEIKIHEDKDLTSLLSTINTSNAGVKVEYSTTSDTLNITAKDSGTMGKIDITENDFTKALFGTAGTDYTNGVTGQNSKFKVSLDGGKTFTDLERTTNAVSLDGLTVELLGKTDPAKVDTTKPIKFSVETNDDEIVEKMKEFIKDYNAVVELASSKMNAKPDANYDYTPLTDEQKEEMTEKQIEEWDKKAKASVLYNDQYLSSLLSGMRSSMYSMVTDVKGGLASIGITTGEYTSNGKLVMDPDGEKKFRQALAENPERVTQMFSKKSGDPYLRPSKPGYDKDNIKNSGLGYKLDVVFNNFAGTYGGNGILIDMAGKQGQAVGQDSLSVSIQNIDKELKNLSKRLKAEEDRYYKQFAAMEKYLSNMNTQSSWLTQQFSSGQ